MDMSRLQQMMGGGAPPGADVPKADTAEKIQISSLSLLKMIKHGMCNLLSHVNCLNDCSICVRMFVGRAGIPMEVMGLMLGQFIDEYTITCIDVFAMPQVCIIFYLS